MLIHRLPDPRDVIRDYLRERRRQMSARALPLERVDPATDGRAEERWTTLVLLTRGVPADHCDVLELRFAVVQIPEPRRRRVQAVWGARADEGHVVSVYVDHDGDLRPQEPTEQAVAQALGLRRVDVARVVLGAVSTVGDNLAAWAAREETARMGRAA